MAWLSNAMTACGICRFDLLLRLMESPNLETCCGFSAISGTAGELQQNDGGQCVYVRMI